MSISDTTTGLILEIQKMSTEDGPGLRTTVFLKGCSLSCRWCHNPESISPRPQVRWTCNRCIGCRSCISICPVGAISLEDDGIEVNREVCTGCGACSEGCPSGALETWGKNMTAEELVREIVKDKAYFGSSGGVTLSGGEAALQAVFVKEVFGMLKAEGIHTALDTCGMCSSEQLKLSCEYADLILFDIKEIDPERHRAFTHGSLDRVKRSFSEVLNILETAAIHNQAWPDHSRKRLWIRTPVIPGMTDRIDNITGIADFLLEQGEDAFDRWELCAFNNLCADKYRRLGRRWELEGTGLMSSERMDTLTYAAVDAGIDPDKVGWNGMVRNKNE